MADDLEVKIVEGFLAEFKADVIVNSTNRNLNLGIGYLSKYILKNGGPRLKSECEEKYPDGISLGEVAVTNGYDLNCKRVYHGALPFWQSGEVDDPLKILCRFVCKCMELAHSDNMSSIAFPALGCGFLSYPVDQCSETIFQCVAMFKSQHEVTTLKVIYIVIFTKAADWKHVKQGFVRSLHGARPPADLLPQASKAETQGFFSWLTSYFRPGKKDATTAAIASPVRDHQVPGTSQSHSGGDGNQLSTGPIPFFNIDLSQTCIQEHARNSCKKVLKCGHICSGFKNEKDCPPCLQPNCVGNNGVNITADDDCIVCYSNPLRAAPICMLKCGHAFHLHCVRRVLENRWVGARITFNFTLCPLCKGPMEHPVLDSLMRPIRDLQDDVKRKAMMRAQYEGLDKSEEVTSKDSPHYKDVLGLAMERFSYYICTKCKKPFFAGNVQCEDGMEEEEDVESMVCGVCSGLDNKVCKVHGEGYMEYKCRYCCSVAVFFCFGNTHFCNECHRNFMQMRHMDPLPACPAGPVGVQLVGKCPLEIEHPPTGTEFCLGCGLCSNIKTF